MQANKTSVFFTMTSWHGNDFHITGPLCGKSIVHQDPLVTTDSTAPTLPPHEKLGFGFGLLVVAGLFFRCKHSQLPNAQCHVNMACYQWLETWDVAIIYTGGDKELCHCSMDVSWLHDIFPSKIRSNCPVNSRVMTEESQTQSWNFTSEYPLHYFVAKTHICLT